LSKRFNYLQASQDRKTKRKKRGPDLDKNKRERRMDA